VIPKYFSSHSAVKSFFPVPPIFYFSSRCFLHSSVEIRARSIRYIHVWWTYFKAFSVSKLDYWAYVLFFGSVKIANGMGAALGAAILLSHVIRISGCNVTGACQQFAVTFASPAIRHWGTCPLDFQQFFQLTLELHKIWQRLCAVVSPNMLILRQNISKVTAAILKKNEKLPPCSNGFTDQQNFAQRRLLTLWIV